MKLNEAKTKYLIFHRTQQQFATRLTVNGKVLERQKKVSSYWVYGWKRMWAGRKTLKNFIEMLTPD